MKSPSSGSTIVWMLQSFCSSCVSRSPCWKELLRAPLGNRQVVAIQIADLRADVFLDVPVRRDEHHRTFRCLARLLRLDGERVRPIAERAERREGSLLTGDRFERLGIPLLQGRQRIGLLALVAVSNECQGRRRRSVARAALGRIPIADLARLTDAGTAAPYPWRIGSPAGLSADRPRDGDHGVQLREDALHALAHFPPLWFFTASATAVTTSGCVSRYLAIAAKNLPM
jgi:hypothetical protein